jgi:hypothetical protein
LGLGCLAMRGRFLSGVPAGADGEPTPSAPASRRVNYSRRPDGIIVLAFEAGRNWPDCKATRPA